MSPPFAGSELSIELLKQRQGQPRPIFDVLIAATALEQGLTMVTRNIKDFKTFGLPILTHGTAKKFSHHRPSLTGLRLICVHLRPSAAKGSLSYAS